MAVDLADELLAAMLEPARLEDVADLEGRLRRLVDVAAAAWPELALDPCVFVRRIGETFPDGSPEAIFENLRAGELFLACACLAGDAAALRVFEQRYLPVATAALARFDDDLDFRTEALQQLRIRLFAPDQPRIAEYDGSGSLEGWVRVVAVRIGLNLKKTMNRHAPVGEVPELEIPDPELDILKARYREHFTVALREAFDDLAPDARRILRFYLVDRLNIAEIGAIVGASRATIGRRVLDCRRVLLDGTRRRLRINLGGASTTEIESVVRLMNSRFDLTLSRVLSPPP